MLAKAPMSALAVRRLRSLGASAQHVELEKGEKVKKERWKEKAPGLPGEETRKRRESEMGPKGGGKRVVISHVQISSRGGEAVPTSSAEAAVEAEEQNDIEQDMDTEVDKVRMSNFTPTSENYIPARDGSCVVRMAPGEVFIPMVSPRQYTDRANHG